MAFQEDLAHEFPEFKAEIHTLKTTDMHFKKLFDLYDTTAKELHRHANGASGITDEHAEDLKKQRLKLKDELHKMLEKASGGEKKAGGCGTCCCG